ncbi:MAG: amidohydrolase, partial [Rhizobiaceae bacterium]
RIGQGNTRDLHHPEYDFNDEIIPLGCSFWVRLVETAMPTN